MSDLVTNALRRNIAFAEKSGDAERAERLRLKLAKREGTAGPVEEVEPEPKPKRSRKKKVVEAAPVEEPPADEPKEELDGNDS